MELVIKSPYDRSVVGSVVKVSKEDANKLLQNAYILSRDKSKHLFPHERIAILEKLVLLLKEDENTFAMLIAKEGGKPLIDAKVEVSRAIDGIKLAIREMMHVIKGEEIPMGYSKSSENRLAFTVREPIGVVLAISAFNHPLNLIVHQVIPAVAVGCPVLIKPAGATALTCLQFVKLLHEAGLPEQWCVCVPCDVTVAEFLVSDSRVSFFSFIGSSEIGWHLRNKLAQGTRYALEHGGVAPVIVDKDIEDIDLVVSSIVKGAYYHAGQVCISTKRVYIHNDMMRVMSAKITDAVSKLKIGDPCLIETQVGPLINEKEVVRVAEWVKEAVSEGATLLCGGNKISDTLYQATLLLEPSKNSKVSTKEVFGPVLCLYAYDDIDQAISWANSLDLPFQGALFSKNINTITKVYKNLDCAAVIINDHSAFRVDWMPFAGRRSTGHGIGGIGHTMHEMTVHKMIVIN